MGLFHGEITDELGTKRQAYRCSVFSRRSIGAEAYWSIWRELGGLSSSCLGLVVLLVIVVIAVWQLGNSGFYLILIAGIQFVMSACFLPRPHSRMQWLFTPTPEEFKAAMLHHQLCPCCGYSLAFIAMREQRVNEGHICCPECGTVWIMACDSRRTA